MDASSVTEVSKLKVFFLPFLSPGHMIPLVDIAKIFARHGVKVTIITTPFNAKLFKNSIDLHIKSGYQISLHFLHFPAADVGLPEGIENFNTAKTPQHSQKLYFALRLLQPQIEKFIRENHPHCIVTDMFYPWTNDLASDLGIPRIYFDPSNLFSQCAIDSLQRYYTTTSDDKKSTSSSDFILPDLPDEIKMTKSQIPEHLRIQSPYTDFIKRVRDSIPGSFGCVVNSFYELEPAYVDHFKKFLNNKVWSIGPVSLISCNEDTVSDDKAKRNVTGHESSELNCLSWLDSKKPNSVIYVSFGSMTGFGWAQLHEIAFGLEASGHPFIWVIRKPNIGDEAEEQRRWLPDGFEEKMKETDKGLIITTWAPQLLILEHPAIGGFVTHAGWNSVLESVGAGVPMITWPLYAEQLYNEKLVTQVLSIGVPVGVENEIWSEKIPEMEEEKVTVTREKIEKVVIGLMDGGDEAMQQIRKRVQELGEIAKKAVEKGGSSDNNITHLIQQIRLYGTSGN